MNHRVVVWVRFRAWVESVFSRMSAGAALCLVALFALGCGGDDGREPVAEVGQNLTFPPASFPATSATVDLTLPPLQTSDRQSLTLAAKTSLSINDRTTTTGASASGGPVTGTNDVNSGSVTATGNISLGARARTGVLRSGGTVNVGPGSATGTRLQGQTLPATSAIRFPVSIPAATQNVTAAPNEVATLNPGSYGQLLVNAGARLTLTSGTFFFRSFDLEPNAQLIVPSGGATIFVTGSVIYRGSINDGGNATRLRFFALGTAQVRTDAPFRGLLVAPNAPVSIAPGSSSGFFYGTTLRDEPAATFAPISEPLSRIAPALVGTGVPFNATQGSSFNGVVASFSDGNQSDTASRFTATINWGDGTAPSPGVVGGAAGSFTVSGTHTYASTGDFNVSVSLLNNVTGVTAAITSTAHVVPGILTSGVNVTAVRGVLATHTVATIADANPADTAASFTATINWGDGTAPSAGSLFDSGTPGVFLVAGSHTYAAAGSYTLSITVTHTLSGGLGSATAIATVTVSSFALAGLDFAASPASPFTGTIAIVSGADASESTSTLSASVAWGDGTTSSGFVVDAGSPGSFLVGGTHQYASAGSFTATITVTSSSSGSSASATAIATVGGELSTSPFPLDATAGAAFTGLLASLTDTNTSDTAADFTVTVDWGDGTPPDAGFAVDGGTPGLFLIFGTHTYASSGSFTATATITKTSSGEIVTATTTATVL